MNHRPDRDVYSVGRLNREVRLLLEAGLPPIWVEGEISNFSLRHFLEILSLRKIVVEEKDKIAFSNLNSPEDLNMHEV